MKTKTLKNYTRNPTIKYYAVLRVLLDKELQNETLKQMLEIRLSEFTAGKEMLQSWKLAKKMFKMTRQ